MNQHIVDITVIWPDGKWNTADENAYLISSLTGILEHFQSRPISNREEKRDLVNTLGRKYAEIHISPCREVGPVETNQHLRRGGA